MWASYWLIILTLGLVAVEARADRSHSRANHHHNNNNSSSDASASSEAMVLLDRMWTRCSAEVRPMCATNGVLQVLLPNECTLRQLNLVATTVFSAVAMRHCRPSCDLICAAALRPICAYDAAQDAQRTFSNMCDLAKVSCLTNTDWIQLKQGVCVGTEVTDATAARPTSKATAISTPSMPASAQLTTRSATATASNGKTTSVPCRKVFNPVCATFAGVKSTFINECLVNAENAKTGNVWEVISASVCAEDYARSVRHVANGGDVNISHHYHSSSMANNADLTHYGHADVIFAPTIVHTEYIDHDLSPSYGDWLHHNQSPPPRFVSPPAIAPKRQERFPALMPVRVVVDVDDKVAVCKFGAAPVCGTLRSRTRNFDNVCELMLRNIFGNQTWSVLHKGKCECLLNCSDDFEPICVSRNSINYTIVNECFLSYALCQDKRSTWKVLHQGECPAAAKKCIVDKYGDATPGFRYTSSYGTYTTPAPTYGNTSITTTTTAATTTIRATKPPITTATIITPTVKIRRRPCRRRQRKAKFLRKSFPFIPTPTPKSQPQVTYPTHIMHLVKKKKSRCCPSKKRRTTTPSTPTSTHSTRLEYKDVLID